MSAGAQERTPKASPSPIDFSLWLRTEACRQSRKIDALHRRAGPPARTSYLEIRQRRPTECYCRQFLFFRSFYGSSEPGMPLNDHSIPSNPLRPLSLFIIPPDEQPLKRWVPRAPSPRVQWHGAQGQPGPKKHGTLGEIEFQRSLPESRASSVPAAAGVATRRLEKRKKRSSPAVDQHPDHRFASASDRPSKSSARSTLSLTMSSSVSGRW